MEYYKHQKLIIPKQYLIPYTLILSLSYGYHKNSYQLKEREHHFIINLFVYIYIYIIDTGPTGYISSKPGPYQVSKCWQMPRNLHLTRKGPYLGLAR